MARYGRSYGSRPIKIMVQGNRGRSYSRGRRYKKKANYGRWLIGSVKYFIVMILGLFGAAFIIKKAAGMHPTVGSGLHKGSLALRDVINGGV